MEKYSDSGDDNQSFPVNLSIHRIYYLDGTAGGFYSIRQISCMTCRRDIKLLIPCSSVPPKGRRHYLFDEPQEIDDSV